MTIETTTAPASAGRSTRRALMLGAIAGACAAPAIALAGTAPDPAEAELAALLAKLPALEAQEDAACELYADADEAMFEWRRRNPRPEMRECTVGTNAEYEIWRKDPTAFDPNADIKAAMAELAVAFKAWKAREAAAEKNCDHARLEAAHEAAVDAIDELCELAEFIKPRTLAGLKMKARFAEHKPDIAESIVADLLD
jgi:hypothetical protein